MRRSSTLDALFSAPKQGLLAATLMQPERWWYLSDLARHLRVHHATLQRELARLSRAEILVTRRDGNRAYYKANVESPVFPDLRALLLKTRGLRDGLHDALLPHTKEIRVAFVYGSAARGRETAVSDIDLMVLGETTLRRLAPAIEQAEKHLGRPINPSIYRPEEFSKRLAESNHFLRDVLEKEVLFVIGGRDDLDHMARGGARRAVSPLRRGDQHVAPRRRKVAG